MSYSQLSCVIPARNESGYLLEVVSHALSIDQINDVIIVEGGSNDDTWNVAQLLARSDSAKIRAIQQSGKGKFNAVLEGAALCREDLIIIWDADGTVPIWETKKVISRALENGNPCIGDRLRGTIEKGAMQRANYLGNWLFAFLWCLLLHDRPRDMLCGTKVFPKRVYEEIPSWLKRADPYGDFALVATGLSQGFKVESVVVDYRARTYGSTNIHRWSGGLALLRTTLKVYIWALSGYRIRTKK